MSKSVFLGFSFILCVSLSASADLMYTGSLSLSDGGLVGVGFDLAADPPDDATLEWEVSRDTTDPYNPWHYKYTLSFDPDVDNAISHIAIEVSNPFDSIFNLAVLPEGYYVEAAPEPGDEPTSQDWVPGDMYAIKFDASAGSDVVDRLVIEFDSMRIPDWGDVNAKGGQADNGGWYLYNSGFSANEDNDPIFDPASQLSGSLVGVDYVYTGSYLNHVVVPDTQVVPLPASVLLGILGMGAAGIKLRKRA